MPVLLAVAVGISQIYLAQRQNLSPSKGGGFGLFSTVDKLENRNLRAYLITEKQEIPFVITQNVPVTEPLRKPIYRAASLPTERHLRVIIDDLLKKPYQMAGKGGAVEIPIKGIRVEIWKMAFDPTALKASRVKITELTVNRSADGAR